MQARVVILDTLTGEITSEIHDLPEFTPEALRQLIILENQEQVCEEYDGSSLVTMGSGVEGNAAWIVLKEQGDLIQGDQLIFIHAYRQ